MKYIGAFFNTSEVTKTKEQQRIEELEQFAQVIIDHTDDPH